MKSRECPRIGDIVRIPVEMNRAGMVEACVGIHLYVRLFTRSSDLGLSYIRRDSVEIISRVNNR